MAINPAFQQALFRVELLSVPLTWPGFEETEALARAGKGEFLNGHGSARLSPKLRLAGRA